MTARPTLHTEADLDRWLERAAKGAREVMADYRGALMRGNMQVDTESTPQDAPTREDGDELRRSGAAAPAGVDQFNDLTAAHFLATCSIPLWLRSCRSCKRSKPEDKELCDSCQQRIWDEEAEWRGEEQDRKRFEHSTSL